MTLNGHDLAHLLDLAMEPGPGRGAEDGSTVISIVCDPGRRAHETVKKLLDGRGLVRLGSAGILETGSTIYVALDHDQATQLSAWLRRYPTERPITHLSRDQAKVTQAAADEDWPGAWELVLHPDPELSRPGMSAPSSPETLARVVEVIESAGGQVRTKFRPGSLTYAGVSLPDQVALDAVAALDVVRWIRPMGVISLR